MSEDPPQYLRDAVLIARLQEQVEAGFKRVDARQDDQQKRMDDHQKRDDDAFDRMSEFQELSQERMEKRFDKIEGLLQELRDDKNRRDGAMALGKVAAGIVGGLVTLIGEFAARKLIG